MNSDPIMWINKPTIIKSGLESDSSRVTDHVFQQIADMSRRGGGDWNWSSCCPVSFRRTPPDHFTHPSYLVIFKRSHFSFPVPDFLLHRSVRLCVCVSTHTQQHAHTHMNTVLWCVCVCSWSDNDGQDRPVYRLFRSISVSRPPLLSVYF